MEAFIGVILGGVVSILTTLSVDVVRSKRELKRRWDSDALEAITHFVEVASRTIGAFYDEGRSRGRVEARDTVDELDQKARIAMDDFRVAHTRARLLLPSMNSALNEYRDKLVVLKELANEGFDEGEASWRNVQNDLNSQLERLLAEGAGKLKIDADAGGWPSGRSRHRSALTTNR